MRSISKLLGLSVMLLAVPALAQTIDGGVGTKTCNVDKDCGATPGTGICGWICDWDVTPHVCMPAINQAHTDGTSTSKGWCDSVADCACSDQTACTNNYCSPAIFSDTTTPQCICDSDCASGHCDGVLQMCQPQNTTGACNYDGECGCGCFCLTPQGGSGGQCECTGAAPPSSCTTDQDCDPQGCMGESCVNGACVHNYADCILTDGGFGSSSSSSSGSASTASSSSGGNPSSATTSANSSSSGSSSSASASSSSSSSGSTSAGACFQVGTACSGNSDCCNQYCDTGTCHCNKAETPGKYPCITQADCCSGSCTGGLCVGGAASTTTGTSGGASSSAAASSGGSSSSSGGASTSSKSSGGGCSTGGGGAGGLALLALGLVALARRKRV